MRPCVVQWVVTPSRRDARPAHFKTRVVALSAGSVYVSWQSPPLHAITGTPAATGVTPAFATLVRALPSGWGLYAVEAAGRSDWLTAVGVLVGLAAAIALLLLVWSWKLGSPRAARATSSAKRKSPSSLFASQFLGLTLGRYDFTTPTLAALRC